MLDIKKEDLQIAQLTAYKAKNYEITEGGIHSITTADIAYRFAKHDEFKNVVLLQKKDDLLGVLSADNAKLTDDELDLKGSVVYVRSDDFLYKSQEAKYDRKNDILTSNVPFESKYGKDRFDGKDLIYSLKDKNLYANDVKMILKTEK